MVITSYQLAYRNIALGITFLPRSKIEPLKMDLTGVALVLELARYAQFLLEFGADILEKAKDVFLAFKSMFYLQVQSLLLWRRPRVTAAFLCLCVIWFIAACFLSMSTCLTIFGMSKKSRLKNYICSQVSLWECVSSSLHICSTASPSFDTDLTRSCSSLIVCQPLSNTSTICQLIVRREGFW